MIRQDVKPRYEVEELPGTRMVTKVRRNEDTKMNETYTEEEPAGFMVYFPAGHSLRVGSLEELHRLGFDAPPELIDMDNGEVVGQPVLSLKTHVQRRVGAVRRSDVGSTDANQGT